MFKIDKEAEKYIADLFKNQEDKTLALKVDITKAGTPIATVNFNFCFPKDLLPSYEKFSYQGFDVYIDKSNFNYLKESEVSLKFDNSQTKLTITAPNAKGTAPDKNAPLNERIAYFIATEVSPQLASHGGFVEFIQMTENKSVVLNFGGGCQGCSAVSLTLKNGVESQLRTKFPQIKGVLDSTDHSHKENAYM